MRSTASHTSYSTEPLTPPPTPIDSTPSASYYDEEEEQAYIEAQHQNQTSFRTSEQDWLDSILDDLGASSDYPPSSYQVSVVDADEDEEMQDAATTTNNTSDCDQQANWHPPLFPAPASSSPPTSPRFIPIPDADMDDDCSICADSPPTSPPGLEADDMESSDDEDDEYHYGMMESSEELRTPSASTEFPQTVGPVADMMLFSNLPFNRLRGVCDAQMGQAETY